MYTYNNELRLKLMTLPDCQMPSRFCAIGHELTIEEKSDYELRFPFFPLTSAQQNPELTALTSIPANPEYTSLHSNLLVTPTDKSLIQGIHITVNSGDYR